MTKDKVLAALWEKSGEYVSGESLAQSLSVSRTAVWKAVDQLRREGYPIESVTNRGYRLTSRGGRLNALAVRDALRHQELDIRVYETITSTNTVLKQMAEEGAPEGLVLISGEQTAGLGRKGRSFYSPAGSGLYMSLLLRPSVSALDATALTVCSAVAVAESVEELTGQTAQIKWVNDVYADGLKVCGILTEGAVDLELGTLKYAVIGIGINITHPEGGFPAELQGIAGAIQQTENGTDIRGRLAAAVLDRVMDFYRELPEIGFYDAYKARSFLLGKPVNILSPGRDPEPATAVDIAPDFSLIVRMEDGTTRALNSGEVSIRPL